MHFEFVVNLLGKLFRIIDLGHEPSRNILRALTKLLFCAKIVRILILFCLSPICFEIYFPFFIWSRLCPEFHYF